MAIFKKPWFLILLIVAAIYTYQFYNTRVEISTTQAEAVNPSDDAEENAEKDPISVKISQEFPANRSTHFDLSAYYNMSVKFVKTDGSKVIVSLIGEGTDYKNDGQRLADWFQVSSAGNTLKIKNYESSKFKKFGSMKELAKSITGKESNSNFTMIIEYPENFQFEKLNLELVSSDVYAEELPFKDMKMATVSGDLRLKNSTGKHLEIESVSGDVNAEIKGLEKAEMASVSGDAVLTAEQTSPDVKFESVSGDLKLNIPENSKVDVSFNSMTGDLINDFGNSPDAGKKLNFSSLSGSATIHKIK